VAADILERTQRDRLAPLNAEKGRCRVECEALLPDYKEEAHRVVRVDVKTRIRNRNLYLQGNRLVCEIDGVCTFNFIYLTSEEKEGGRLSSHLIQENFSHSFQVPSPSEELDPDQIPVLVEISAENVAHKMLGPRRISVRCDLILSMDAKYREPFSFYSPQENSDVKCRSQKVELPTPVCIHREDFSLTETLALPKAYLSIGEMVDLDAALYAQKAKAEEGGISFCGNVALHCSYISSEDGRIVSLFQPMEFQKRIGIPRVEENDQISITLCPNFLKGSVETNEEGENKNLTVELGYTAEIAVYRTETVSIVEDAFSTKHQLHCESEEVVLEEICGSFDLNSTLRERFPAEEVFLRTEHIRCNVEFKNSYLREQKIIVEGRMYYRFLGIRENGEAVNVEKERDFSCPVSLDSDWSLPKSDPCRIEITGGVKALDLDPDGMEYQLRLDLYGNVVLYRQRRIQTLRQIQKGEALQEREHGILYLYPENGEELWNLCKNRFLSPEKVCEENKISMEAPLPSVLRITV